MSISIPDISNWIFFKKTILLITNIPLAFRDVVPLIETPHLLDVVDHLVRNVTFVKYQPEMRSDRRFANNVNYIGNFTWWSRFVKRYAKQLTSLDVSFEASSQTDVILYHISNYTKRIEYLRLFEYKDCGRNLQTTATHILFRSGTMGLFGVKSKFTNRGLFVCRISRSRNSSICVANRWKFVIWNQNIVHSLLIPLNFFWHFRF